MMQSPEADRPGMEQTEHELLSDLRRVRRSLRLRPLEHGAAAEPLTLGQRVADSLASILGSWTFIVIQTAVLFVWISANLLALMRNWDPYPFILLNLALSFQAAYAAPFIMMSQNRQAAIDRAAAHTDYQINAKAELEIELLHQKLDLLRETEVSELIAVIRRLEARLPPQDREFLGDLKA